MYSCVHLNNIHLLLVLLCSFHPLFIKNAEGGHLKINDTDLLNSNGESLYAVANDREYEKI